MAQTPNSFLGRSAFFTVICALACVMAFGAARAQHAGQSVSADLQIAESHAERADRLRRESRDRATSKLGYESVADPDEQRSEQVDYHALGSIISRLGEIIQRVEAAKARRKGAGPHIPGLPGGNSASNPLQSTYGPDGPTERSVKALLSYRLVTLGNPNLKIGTVVDKGPHIAATVTTREGSLVAAYAVDKKTGQWRQSQAVR